MRTIFITSSILDNIACFDSAPDKTGHCRVGWRRWITSSPSCHWLETEMLPGTPFFSAGEMQRLVLAPVQPAPGYISGDGDLDKTTAQKVAGEPA